MSRVGKSVVSRLPPVVIRVVYKLETGSFYLFFLMRSNNVNGLLPSAAVL